MPLYEYECPEGHIREELRRYEDRERPAYCQTCLKRMERILSAHHQAVDGIYSYAPNVGDQLKHERWEAKIKDQEANKER